MAKLIDKMMDVMGFGGDEDFEEEVEEIEEKTEVSNIRNLRSRSGNSKIVNIHTNIKMEVVVTDPESYEEAQEICDHIKSKTPVVINLEFRSNSLGTGLLWSFYAQWGYSKGKAMFIIAQNVDKVNSF